MNVCTKQKLRPFTLPIAQSLSINNRIEWSNDREAAFARKRQQILGDWLIGEGDRKQSEVV